MENKIYHSRGEFLSLAVKLFNSDSKDFVERITQPYYSFAEMYNTMDEFELLNKELSYKISEKNVALKVYNVWMLVLRFLTYILYSRKNRGENVEVVVSIENSFICRMKNIWKIECDKYSQSVTITTDINVAVDTYSLDTILRSLCKFVEEIVIDALNQFKRTVAKDVVDSMKYTIASHAFESYEDYKNPYKKRC